MTERDTEIQGLARRRERRRLLLAQVAALLVGGGVFAAFYVFDDDVRDSLDTPVWLIALGTVVVVAALILGNAFVLVLLRSRRRRDTKLFRSPRCGSFPPSGTARRWCALRRGDQIAPEQRELARRTATDLANRRSVVWLFLVTAPIMAADAFLQPWGTTSPRSRSCSGVSCWSWPCSWSRTRATTPG